MQHGYTYAAALAASQRINWKIEDIIGGDKRLDFTKPFLPNSLAGVAQLHFLNAGEKLILNQIRGHNYLYLFGLVEEFILPFVLNHAMPVLAEDDTRTRALLQFASEEAKHIHLFKIFRNAFIEGFGESCDVIGPPQEIAKAVLAHHPLSVALLILHIEWMTQGHYVESIRDDDALDPTFTSLLKHHWMEEAQHARLDTLMVQQIAAGCTPDEIAKAIDGYLELIAMLDGGLRQQVVLDLTAWARRTRRVLGEAQHREALGVQHQAMRWTFIGSGMSHRNFAAVIQAIHAPSLPRIEAMVPGFS
ncbi:MAG: hypothetical protein ABWY00_06640 [Dongiaceae bacterium]